MTVGWSFHALGVPRPQGSKRHVGNGVMVESSKALPAWRDTVLYAAASCDGPRLDGPIMAAAVFTLPRPKKPRWPYPAVTPDLSKLVRAVEDSVTVAGKWADDARVVSYAILEKRYVGGDESRVLPLPGVVFAACQIDGNESVAMLHIGHTLIYDAVRQAHRELAS